MKEEVAEKEKLNWRVDHIVKGGAGIGLAWVVCGLGFSSYWIMRCSSVITFYWIKTKLDYYHLKDHEHRETVSFKKRWKTHFYPNLRDYRYSIIGS